MHPIFRHAALDCLSSPEQLEQLMQVVNPRHWLALATCGTLVGATLLWGLWGRWRRPSSRTLPVADS
jgi:HlyD family secretion protein